MEQQNDIEIKLLANKRFVYSNHKNNIVISSEHLATCIKVLYPEEYKNYSKRVDFVNSEGKSWTEALYIPEYQKYNDEFDKLLFNILLPSEVTTQGELNMQFIAYKQDKSMTIVPFEIIPIDVQSGLLAFRKNARKNPDLLMLCYNRSTDALFKAEQAKDKAIKAEEQSIEAINAAREATNKADSTFEKVKQIENIAAIAHDKSITAMDIAKETKNIADTANLNVLEIIKRADSGEFKGDKGEKGDVGATGKSVLGFRYDENTGNLYVNIED